MFFSAMTWNRTSSSVEAEWQMAAAEGWDFCLLYCVFKLLMDTCIPTPQSSSHGATCAFRDLIGKHPVKLSGNALIDSLL